MLPLIHPATLKALLSIAAPWLAGGAAVGSLAGLQSVENAKQREQLARQQAEIEQLKANNAALERRLETNAKPDKKAQKPSPTISTDTPKHGFLKRILEANRKLRDDIAAQPEAGEQTRG